MLVYNSNQWEEWHVNLKVSNKEYMGGLEGMKRKAEMMQLYYNFKK